jgi:hypothetical protein
MSKVSSAANAILDAWENEWNKASLCHDQHSIAAVLRAAALYCERDRLQLLAIADELEAMA